MTCYYIIQHKMLGRADQIVMHCADHSADMLQPLYSQRDTSFLPDFPVTQPTYTRSMATMTCGRAAVPVIPPTYVNTITVVLCVKQDRCARGPLRALTLRAQAVAPIASENSGLRGYEAFWRTRGAMIANRCQSQDRVAPSFSPMKPRTCWAMASSVGSRSIELAP